MYARPATPVFFRGLNGFGYSQSLNTQNFEHTLKQWAVSPFSVNSEAYMDRIRKQFGYTDNGTYEAMGTLGGLVGAGVGALLSAGVFKKPVKTPYSILGFVPRRTAAHNVAFAGRTLKKEVQDAVKKHNLQLGDYNEKVKLKTQATKAASNVDAVSSSVSKKLYATASSFFENTKSTKSSIELALSKARETFEQVKDLPDTDPIKVARLNEITKYQNQLDLITRQSNIQSELLTATDSKRIVALLNESKTIQEQTKSFLKVTDVDVKDIDKVAEALSASNKLEKATKNLDEATKLVNKSADGLKAAGVVAEEVTGRMAKKIGGLLPTVGTAVDIASLGLSVAGFKQSLETGDGINIALNSIMLAADALDVVGDFVPGAGSALSLLAGIVSIGAGAIQGWWVGQTAGHSLSREGLTAQGMWAQNLYQGMIQRPVSSLVTALTMVGIPIIIGAFSSADTTKRFGKFLHKTGIQQASSWLSSNALGNQVRAGLSMFALQGVTALTEKVDKALGTIPDNPEDLSFVSAISLIGDLNDNLYGATRNKSILLGLAKKDPNAMINAMSRAWGFSDEMYYSPTFDDIRQGLNVDLSPIGNSLFSVLGELIIDPQNYKELYQTIHENKVTNIGSDLANRELDYVAANVTLKGGEGKPGTTEVLFDETGIFNPGRTHREGRRSAIKLLFKEYLTNGHKGLRKELSRQMDTYAKGANGTLKGKIANMDQQLKALEDYFKDILSGNQRKYLSLSPEEQIKNKQIFSEYAKLNDKIKKNEPLLEEEEAIKTRMNYTFKALRDIYGEEEVPALISKFINEFDIEMDYTKLNYLYVLDRNLRAHMDLTDTVARTATSISNPVMSLVKYGAMGFRQHYEMSRRNLFGGKDSARTIVTIQEMQKNRAKIYDLEDIKEIESAREARKNYNTKSIREPKIYKTPEEKAIAQKVEAALVPVIKKAQETEKSITEIENEYNKKNKELTAKKEEFTYFIPMKYIRRGRSTVTINNEKDLANLKQEIKKFEDDTKELLKTPDAVEKYIAQNKNSQVVLDYKFKVDAVRAYELNVVYAKETRDIYKLFNGSLALLNTLQREFTEDTLALLYLFGTFKKWVGADGKALDQTAWEKFEEYYKSNSVNAEAILARYGMIPAITVKETNGTDTVYTGLQAIKIARSSNLPLSVSFDVPKETELLKILFEASGITDIESFTHGRANWLNTIKTISADEWNSFSLKDKYNFIRDTIIGVGLPEEAIRKLISVASFKRLRKAFEDIILNEPETIRRVIPLESLSDNTIRQYVSTKLLATKSVSETVEKVKERLGRINESISSTLEEYKGKHSPDKLKALGVFLTNEVFEFNKKLENNEVFRYIQAIVQPDRTAPENKVGLFISSKSRDYLLPKFIDTKKNSGNTYQEEEVLKEYFDNPIIQKLMTDKRKEAYEYITKEHFNELSDDDELKTAKSEELKKAAEEKEVIRSENEKITTAFYDKLNESLPQHKESYAYDVDPLSYDIDISSQLEKTQQGKGLTLKYHDFKTGLFFEVLDNKGAPLFKKVSIKARLKPTMFMDEDRTVLNYFQILYKENRDVSDHNDFMTAVVKQILFLIQKSNNRITLNEKALVELEKLPGERTEDFIVRRMVATFQETSEETGDVLTLDISIDKENLLANIYKKSLIESIKNYLVTHRNKLSYIIGKIDDQAIQTFKDSLKEQNDSNKKIIGIILDNANIIFNESLKKYNLFDEHYAFKNLSEDILDREQQDVHSLGDRYLGASGDLVKRKIVYNPLVLELFRDATAFLDHNEATEYETDLFLIVSVLNNYIEENHRNKKTLNLNKVKVRIEENKNTLDRPTIKFEVDNDKDLSLFDLIYSYNCNLETIFGLIKKITLDESKVNENAPSIQKIQAIIQTEYMHLLDVFGGVLNHDVLELNEELMKSQGATNEDLDKLKDFEVAVFFNNIKTNDYLDTLIKSVGEANSKNKKKDQNYKNLKTFITQEIKDIYEQAKIDVLSAIKNPKRYDLSTLVLLRLFESNLDETVKKTLIKRIFFEGYRIDSANANEEEIKKLKTLLKQEENALQDAEVILNATRNDYNQAAYNLIHMRVINLRKEINQRKFEFENTINRNLENFDDFYLYMLNNQDKIPELFNTKPEKYKHRVLAREVDAQNNFIKDSKYYMVDKSNKEIIQVTEGVPPFNIIIGEEIIKRNNPGLVNVYNEKISKNNNQDSHKVLYANSVGAVIQVSAIDNAVLSRKDEYKKLLFGSAQSHNEIFFVTNKQAEQIKNMADNNDYNNTPMYGFKRTKAGKVPGEVVNIVNVSGYMRKVPAYFEDLEMLPSKGVDAFVDKLYEYAALYKKFVVVNKAFLTNVSFNRSQTFLNFLKETRINELYTQFVRYLDPDNSNSFNLENITNKFFKDLYIFKQADGTFYNIDNIENDFDITFIAYLKKIEIDGKNLFERIKDALKYLQNKYSYADFRIGDTEVFSESFMDTLVSMTHLADNIVHELKGRHNYIYKKVIKSYENKVAKGMILHATAEESKERNKISNDILKDVYKDSGHAKIVLSNPKDATSEERKKAVESLRVFYNSKVDISGIENRDAVAVKYRGSRKESKERTEAINKSRRVYSRSNIRFDTWVDDWYDVKKTVYDREYDANTGEKPRPYRFEKGAEFKKGTITWENTLVIKHKKANELKKYTNLIYNAYQKAKTSDNLSEEQQYLVSAIESLPYTIADATDMYHLVRNYFIFQYYGNVNDELYAEPFYDVQLRAVAEAISSNKTQEEANEYVQKAIEAWETKKKKRNFSKLNRYRKELIYDDNNEKVIKERNLYDSGFDKFFFIFKNTEDEETIKSLLDSYVTDIEEHLFTSDKEPIKTKNDTEKKKIIDEKVYVSNQQYLSEGTPEEQAAKQMFFAIYYRDPSKQSVGDVIEESVKRGIYSYSADDIVTNKDGVELAVPKSFFNVLRDIKKLNKNEAFENSSEVYHLIKIPLLDDSTVFRDVFISSVFPNKTIAKEMWKALGVSENDIDSLIEHIKDTKNLAEIVSYLVRTNFSNESMFAFVHLVNQVKLKYIQDTYKAEHNGKHEWSWAWAHARFIKAPIEKAITTAKTLEATETFDQNSLYGNSIIDGVNEHTKIFLNALSTAKKINRRLGSIIVPQKWYNDNDANKVDYDIVVEYQSKINVLSRKMANKITNVLFNAQEDFRHYGTSLDSDFTRDFNSVTNELMLELSSPSIESVGSISPTYNKIRSLFTEVLKILKANFLPNEFIRIQDVGTALLSFTNDSSTVRFYENALNDYMKQVEPDRVTNAMKAVEAITAGLSEFKHVAEPLKDDVTVKAILGYILHHRFHLVYKDNLEAENKLLEYIEKQVDIQPLLAKEHIHSLASQLDPTRSSEELAIIIFDKELKDLEKDEQEALEYIKKLQSFIKDASALDPNSTEDTLELAFKNTQTLYGDTNYYTKKELRALIILEENKKLLKSLIAKKEKLIKEMSSVDVNDKITKRLQALKLSEDYTKAKAELVKLIQDATTAKAEYEERIRGEPEGAAKDALIEELADLEASMTNYSEVLTDIITFQNLTAEEKIRESYLEIKKELDESKTKRQQLFDKKEIEEATKEKEEEDALDALFFVTPRAVHKFVSSRSEQLKTIEEGFSTYKKELAKKYGAAEAEHFINWVDSEQANASYFSAPKYNLYSKIDSFKDLSKAFDAVKEDLEVLHIKTVDELKVWYEKTKADVKKHRDAFADLSKHKSINVAGKIIKLRYAFQKMKDNEYLSYLGYIKDIQDIKEELSEVFANGESSKARRVDIMRNHVYNVIRISEENATAVFDDALESQSKLEGTEQKVLLESIIENNKALLNDIVKAISNLGFKQDELESFLKKYQHSSSPLIKSLVEKIERAVRIQKNILNLQSVMDTTEKSYTNTLIKASSNFIKKHNLNESKDSLVLIMRSLSDPESTDLYSNLRETQDEIKSLGPVISTLEKEFERYDYFVNKLEKEMATATEAVNTQTETVNELHKKSAEASEKLAVDRKYTNKNLGLYRKLYGIPAEEDDPLYTDEKVIEDLVEEAKEIYFINPDAEEKITLEKVIERSGDSAIHNSVIDTLITRKVYIKQLETLGRDVPDKFFVFDMETYKDAQLNNSPYQITVLEQTKDKQGKTVLKVMTEYINSPIFFSKPGTQYYPQLQAFYKQQQKILHDQYPEMSEEEINKKTDDLVKRIKQYKNSPEFIKVFIALFSTNHLNRVPIVAHNGNRFDFGNYDTFLQTYASRLIKNFYYAKMTERDSPEKIEKRIMAGQPNITVEAQQKLLLEYSSRIESIMNRYNESIKEGRFVPFTEEDIEHLRELNKARTALSFAIEFAKASAETNNIYNSPKAEELRQKEEELKTKVYNYIVSKDMDERNRIKSEIVEYYLKGAAININEYSTEDKMSRLVSDALDKIIDEYTRISNGIETIDYNSESRKSFRTQLREDLLGKEKVETDYSQKNAIQHIDGLLQQIEESLIMIKGNRGNVEAAVASISEEVRTSKEELERLKKERIKISNELDSAILSQEKLFEKMIESAKAIQDRIKNPNYRSTLAYNRFLKEDEQFQRGNRTKSASLLTFEMGNAEQNAAKSLESLIKLINYLENTTLSKENILEYLRTNRIEIDMFEKIVDEASKKKYLDDTEKRIQELYSFLEESDRHVLSTSFKTLVDEYINKEIEKATKGIDGVYVIIEKLWNSEEFKELFKGSTEYKVFENIGDGKYQYANYKVYVDILKELGKEPGVKDNQVFKDLLKLLHSNSILSRWSGIINMKNTSDLYEDSEINKLIREAVIADINILNSRKGIVSSDNFVINPSSAIDFKKINMSIVSAYFEEYMNLATQKLKLESLDKRANIIGVLMNKVPELSLDAPLEEAAKIYSLKYPKEFINALDNKNIKRVYKHGLQDADKSGIAIKPDALVGVANRSTDSDKDYVKVGYIQPITQDYIFLGHSKQDFVKSNIRFNYSYKTLDNRFLPYKQKGIDIQLYEVEYEEINGIEVEINKPKSKETFEKDLNEQLKISGVSDGELYFKNGVDFARESAMKLFKFYQEGCSRIAKVKYEDTKAVIEKYENDLVTWDHHLYTKVLERINITQIIEDDFLDYLELLLTTGKPVNKNDAMRLYRGVANQLLSKVENLEARSHLTMIPKEYSDFFITSYDQADLNRLKIDLLPSSEGSAGSTFVINSFYNVDIPFRQFTNPTRSVLSVGKLSGLFTPNPVINWGYEEDDRSETKRDFMSYFFSKDKTTGSYKLSKGLIKYHEIDDKRKERLESLLIDQTDKGLSDVFIPNVLTDSMYDRYKLDILHRIGTNLEVAFVNHPRAFEDGILVDEDDAKALGMEEGSKTWLSLDGFKGGLVYVKDLRKVYGVSIVANADSLMKRGAGGLELEMAINNIRTYFLNNDTAGLRQETKDLIKKHEQKLKEIFKITDDGKVIVDAYIDYNEVLNSIENDLVTKLITAKPLKTDYQFEIYKATAKNKKQIITTNTSIRYGKLYVISDPEHTPEDMANHAKAETLDGYTFAMKNIKASVRDGVLISPSVVYTMESKGDVDWQAAFPTDYQRVSLYSKLYSEGAKGIIDLFRTKYKLNSTDEISLEQFVYYLENEVSLLNYVQLFRDYLTYDERIKRHSSLTSEDVVAFDKYKIAEINLKIKNQALETLTAKNGAIYNSTYRKHPGIRQQLLPNVDLSLGVVLVSRQGFRELMNIEPGWLHEDIVSTSSDEWKSIEEDLKKMSTVVEKVDYLNKLGFINEPGEKDSTKLNYTLINPKWDKKEGDSDRKLISADDIVFEGKYRHKYYGWVLGIRSPVQDYNAVPMLKVTGYNNHHTVEANAYVYKIIGGDNDGDTLGMVAVNFDNYKYLKGLDATKEEYYDAQFKYDKKNKRWVSYLEVIERDLNMSEPNSHTERDARYYYAGKNTFAEGTRNHYSWYELYRIAYGESILESITDSKDTGIDANEKKFYIDVIRRMHGDAPEDDEDLLKTYQSEILKIKEFDRRIEKKTDDRFIPADVLTITQIKDYRSTLSNIDRANIKDVSDSDLLSDKKYEGYKNKIAFNIFYNKMLQQTIQRIQVSKRGVNAFGNIRKQILLRSDITNKFPEAFKDTTGESFGKFYNNGNMSAASFLATLDIKNSSLDEFKDFKSFRDMVLKKGNQDSIKSVRTEVLNEILRYCFDIINEANVAKVVAKDFMYLNNTNDIQHFNNILLHNPNLLKIPLIQDLQKKYTENKSTKISTIDLEIVKFVLFGRLGKDIDDEKLNKMYELYINQPLISRESFKLMSDDATKIIGVAKHGGLDIDAADYLDAFMRNLRLQLESLTNGRYMSVNESDLKLTMAMAADARVFELNKIYLHKDEELSNEKLELDKTLKAATNYKQRYTSAPEAYANINAMIEEAFNIEFFGIYQVPNERRDLLRTAIKRLFEIYKQESNDIEALKKAETEIIVGTNKTIADVLQNNNISGYQIRRFLIKANTIFNNGNAIYNKSFKTKQLSAENIELIKDSSRLLHVLHFLTTKAEKLNLENSGRNKAPKLTKILLNEHTVDAEYLQVDESGQVVRILGESSVLDGLQYDRDDLQSRLDNLKEKGIYIPREKIQALSDIEKQQLDAFLQRLLSTQEQNDGRMLLQELQSDFDLSSLLYKRKHGEIEKVETKGVKSSFYTNMKNATDATYDFLLIKPYTQDINKSQEEYNKNKIRLKEIENRLAELSAAIVGKANLVETKERVSKNFKGLVDEDILIENLEKQKEELFKRKKEIQKQISDYAFTNHFKTFSSFMHTDDGTTRSQLYKEETTSLLTEEDVKELESSQLFMFANMQVPFLSKLDLYWKDDNSSDIPDEVWKEFFKDYKENHRFSRLTVVMDAFDDEGLVKKIFDFAKKEITTFEGKDIHKNKNLKKYIKEYGFTSVADLEEYMAKITKGEDVPGVIFNNRKKITGISEEVKVGKSITPTLKEIYIKDWKDLKAVYEYIKNNGDKKDLIGFSSLDDIMNAMSVAYKPYKLTGRLSNIIRTLGFFEKLFMRYSTGFLFRNYIDTWFQLMSEQYQRRGFGSMFQDAPEIIKYMGTTQDVFTLYNMINEDRLVTLVDINKKYKLILKLIEKPTTNTPKELEIIKNSLKEITEYLQVYVDIAKAPGENVRRMSLRLETAEIILADLINLKQYADTINANTITNVKVLATTLNKRKIKSATTFLLNTRFAEYYSMHEKLYSDLNKFDKTHVKKIRKINDKYLRKSGQDAEDFKSVLFEISAFMNTNAFSDEFQQHVHEDLHEIIRAEKIKDEDNISQDYEAISKEVEDHFKNAFKDVADLITLRRPYDYINSKIEITGRIAGFLFDRYINSQSFDQAVHNSLRRFFNYGMRSPLELKSMADVPYISFPMRSIDNWITRLSDPRFIILMDDIIDGIYGQYQDDDGQYSEYERFQIENGWLPITKNFGIRLGNGALDIQGLLSNPSSLVTERKRPILRAIQTLVMDKDAVAAIKQLASVGMIIRGANFVSSIIPGSREALQNSGVAPFVSNKKPSLGTTSNIFFDRYDSDYNKYTPNRYRYPNNGRYSRYENIYKNWFNKYGKMRKPLVDPYSLVKDIQWQQYVRWRQLQRR